MKSAPRLTAVLAVAGALSACGRDADRGWSSGEAATRVCVDGQQRRVADALCPPAGHAGSNPFLWYYLGALTRNQGVARVGAGE